MNGEASKGHAGAVSRGKVKDTIHGVGRNDDILRITRGAFNEHVVCDVQVTGGCSVFIGSSYGQSIRARRQGNRLIARNGIRFLNGCTECAGTGTGITRSIARCGIRAVIESGDDEVGARRYNESHCAARGGRPGARILTDDRPGGHCGVSGSCHAADIQPRDAIDGGGGSGLGLPHDIGDCHRRDNDRS